MKRRQLTRTMRDGIALLVVTAACGSDSKPAAQPAGESSPPAITTDARVGSASAPAAAELTAADLDAYARGLARETELVRAAQERARTASTPQARGEAQQAQWEDQTIPDGAKAAGLSPDRYRAVRSTVHRTFQWLDFQGKIDGPLELDTAHASPEMKQQLTRDPFAELSPDSRAALQAMMDRLVPSWVEYVKLTAVAG